MARHQSQTVDERLAVVAEMDEVLATSARRRAELEFDAAALAGLDASCAPLKAERDEWMRELDALLARRARVAAAIRTVAAEGQSRGCPRCGDDRGELAVERVEALLDRMQDGDELAGDRLLAAVRVVHVCAECFDRMIESLDALAARQA